MPTYKDDITENYHKWNEESVSAKELSRKNAEINKKRIINLARQRGPQGITCDEAEYILDLTHQTCSPRFTELKSDGVLYPHNITRKTRSGGNAQVMLLSGD